MIDKKLQGKKNRQSGARFELKVRADLESKGWIVAKWTNNVDLDYKLFHEECGAEFIAKGNAYFCPKCEKVFNIHEVRPQEGFIGKLVKVKNKFLGPGRPMMLGAGFCDFICFKTDSIYHGLYKVIGVEVKSNGKLDKVEKEKCQWLLENNIFSKILIASKGKKRGEIVYKEQ